jgi:uroporphyrinogen-III synthase
VRTLLPLEGFAVAVTADRRSAEQAELLERRGASVMHAPTIRTLYLASDDELRRATRAVIDERPDYLVAMTGIGVRAWFEAATAWGLGATLVAALRETKIVARGPKAAAAAQAAGLAVWERSATERLAGVVEILRGVDLAGATIAVQEDGVARSSLEAELLGIGATVRRVPVYRWTLPEDCAPALRLVEAACSGRIDVITFTSAPAVHNLFAIAAEAGLDGDLRRACNTDVVAACIGPVCAEAAASDGIEAPLAPAIGRLGLLVRAISEHFAGRRRAYRRDGVDAVLQGAVAVVDGERTVLTPKERLVLDTLSSAAPGAVVSRAALLARAWGSAEADPHVLEVTVGRLRRRLGPFGDAIAALPGRGYRLDAVPA